MTVTLADVRQHVWDDLDLTVDDLPTNLIDRWVSEAVNIIASRKNDWPGFQTSSTLTTVTGTQVYSTSFSKIARVEGVNGGLTAMEPSEAQDYFYAPSITTAQPVAYSQWAGLLSLWPTPNAAYTYTLRGTRTPAEAFGQSAGAAIDLPATRAEPLVFDWVLYRAYIHEGDPESSTLFKQQFEDGLTELVRYETPTGLDAPVVVNSRVGQRTLPARLRYPWES